MQKEDKSTCSSEKGQVLFTSPSVYIPVYLYPMITLIILLAKGEAGC